MSDHSIAMVDMPILYCARKTKINNSNLEERI
jgi:hypothetical protein